MRSPKAWYACAGGIVASEKFAQRGEAEQRALLLREAITKAIKDYEGPDAQP